MQLKRQTEKCAIKLRLDIYIYIYDFMQCVLVIVMYICVNAGFVVLTMDGFNDLAYYLVEQQSKLCAEEEQF